MSKTAAKPIASYLVDYAAARVELLAAIKNSRQVAAALHTAVAEARQHQLTIDNLKTKLIELTNFLQKHLFADASGITGSLSHTTAELDTAIDTARELLNELHAAQHPPNTVPQAPLNTEAEASAAG